MESLGSRHIANSEVSAAGAAIPSAVSRQRLMGVLCAGVVVLLFSSFTLVSRLGLTSSLSLFDLAALRFGIAGLLLAPILLRYGLCGLRWRQALTIAFLGGLGFAFFAYAGFALAPATHGAALLHGTLPLFTFLVLKLSAAGPAARAHPAGVALIAGGILLMASDSFFGTSTAQLVGDGSLLLASLCWSAYAIHARRLGLAPARAAAIVAVLSMCGFLPIYLVLPGKMLLAAHPTELVVQGAFQGVLIGVLSIFVYTRAVAALGATETSLFTAAVPCMTTLAAIPLLSEAPSVLAAIGIAVVTVGMVVSLRLQRAAGRGRHDHQRVAARDPAVGLGRMIRLWLSYRRVRQERQQLLAMSDRELRDLGISRVDAIRAAEASSWHYSLAAPHRPAEFHEGSDLIPPKHRDGSSLPTARVQEFKS